ncbi:MAG: tail fiber domain-containing protein, partial [Bdellovibrio sp.]
NLLVSNGTATGVTSLSTPVSGILTSTGGSVPTWSSISSDTFTQYALLTGRSGGQTLNGGAAASNNLTLDSTLNATKGNVLINPSGGNIGIGTTNPNNSLVVMANSGTDPINSSVGTNGITVNTYENATGSVGSNFRNFSARGTFSSPAALLSGDTLGSWNSSGYWTGKTNAQFVSGDSRANITMIATENWSSSAHNGSAITFTTTTNGSPSSGERMRIDNTGNVGIGTGLPSSKLEIYETSNIGSILNISTPGTGTNQQSYLGLVTKADGSTLGTATNKGWFVGARGNSFGSAILQNDFDLSYWNGAAWTDVFSADSITGYVGIGTTVPNSVLTVDGGAGVLSLRAGPSLDHVYLQLFARSATPNTRSGYLGYPGAGSNDIRLFNEISGGNISLMTTGTGAVGIGTTGPSGKLHIQGDNGYGMSLVLTPTNTGNHVVLVPPANDGSVAFGVTNTTNTAWEAYMLNNGTVGYVSLANLSDKRLKKDIKPLGQGVEEILKLNSVEYHWINKDFSQERQIGFIAQEVEKIFPELVSEGPDGYKRVNYVGIIPVLVNAIKEISAKISNLIIKSDSHSRSIASLQSDNQENKSSLQLLKAENAQIKAENTQLKNENALIKSYLCSKDPSATICL